MKTNIINIRQLYTKRFKELFMLSGILFFFNSSWSQNGVLSIEQCYEIAISNSPDLKSKTLDISISEMATNQAKYAFLPTLNAGANHGYNWGQSIDPFTNTFASGRVRTNNISIQSSWDIFTGMMNRYTLNLTHIQKEQSLGFYLLSERNFRNEIASMYAKLQADYLIKQVYEEQLSLVNIVLNNISAKEKAGSVSPFAKLRVEALIKQDSAFLIATKNDIKYTKFVINQMLNITDSVNSSYDFLILDESTLASGLKSFSHWNIDTLSEMQLAHLNFEAAQMESKIAQSQQLPRLTLHSAVGSGYSGNNQELIGTTLVPKPMNVQLSENLFQSAVLTLSIPIFNGYRVKTNMKIAQIKVQQAQLDIEKTEIELTNYIERLLLEYENEVVNSEAKKQVYKINQELYKISEVRFLNGLLNYAEYAEAKYVLTQTKLDYLISLSKCYGIFLFLENLIS